MFAALYRKRLTWPWRSFVAVGQGKRRPCVSIAVRGGNLSVKDGNVATTICHFSCSPWGRVSGDRAYTRAIVGVFRVVWISGLFTTAFFPQRKRFAAGSRGLPVLSRYVAFHKFPPVSVLIWPSFYFTRIDLGSTSAVARGSFWNPNRVPLGLV